MIRDGAKIRDAMAAVGRGVAVYGNWMEPRGPGTFHDEIMLIRQVHARRRGRTPAPVPDFPEFCAEYLHQPLNPHQLRQFDCLQGQPPRDLHTSMRYHRGRPNYLLFNQAPNHAKTTTWTINYAVWRLHRDPSIRIALLSKSLTMAKKYLYAVKARLTGPRYREMQVKFAPEGGWRDPDGSWTRTEIYVSGKDDPATDAEKDPTVQALGIKGQIYGARLDLVILDDIADMSSAGQWEAVLDWISQEIDSRLEDDGTLIMVGTRLAATDVYSKARDDLVEWDGTPVFTYLAQPAVLEYADSSKDWVTLWPGRWDGPKLASKKAMMRDERRWALVYQQADVTDDAVFPAGALQCSVNRRRAPGPLTVEGWGTRAEGMTGLYVIGGLDPATVGHTAALVVGVDRHTGRRYLLDGFDQPNCSPDGMIDRVQKLTETLGVRQWVVERNSFQRFLTQLDQFRMWMYTRGVRLREHDTENNKYDSDFGVAAMAGLFLSCGRPKGDGTGEWERTPDSALIELPTPRISRVTSLLMEQLATWHPTEMRQRQPQDLVMALWFTEIGAREYLGTGRQRQDFLTPVGATRADLAGRRVVNLNDLTERVLAERAGVA